MRISRLKEILQSINTKRILVLGDFFLDQYWSIDPSLVEKSLETGLDAHQVVEVRLSPGAAGTVTNNLIAIGTGTVEVLGCVGTDGNGFELSRSLRERGAVVDSLFACSDMYTPTYTKPMFRQTGGLPEVEGNRIDIKNREPLPVSVETRILDFLSCRFQDYDAVAVLDQVQEKNSGVVTERVVQLLSELSPRFPEVIVMADSRTRITEFRNLILKPNIHEAARAVGIDPDDDLEALVRGMAEMCEAKILMTRGAEGITTWDGKEMVSIPALPVSGEIDIVGAGDSVTAAALSSMAAGASLAESAEMAVAAANVTIRKLGTTGTATAEEMIDAALRCKDQ